MANSRLKQREPVEAIVAALLVRAAMPVTGVQITEEVILQVMGHGMADLGGPMAKCQTQAFSPMTIDDGSDSGKVLA